MKKKRVLFILIDALSSAYTSAALGTGKLPNLDKLVAHGAYREKSVSIFPTITPAATSTLVTGKYPVDHGIFGFHWYDREKDETAYYGDDFWVIAKLGFGEFFDGCIQKLNSEKLICKTIFQQLERRPKLDCASLNYLMFAGDHQHEVKVPGWFSWHKDVPFRKNVSGPKYLYFGDLVCSDDLLEEDSPSRKGGLLGRFGFNDSNTERLLLHFAKEDLFPDFTVAYFPDHDYSAHKSGLEAAFGEVENVDRILGEFFEIYGGVEAALREFYIVITGDHSQSRIVNDPATARIELDEILGAFGVADSGMFERSDRLKICPDMRCAQIYHRGLPDKEIDDICARLIREDRVDQVLTRAPERKAYRVSTRDRGTLIFGVSSEGTEELTAYDIYGNLWWWEGDLSAVDGLVSEGGILHFIHYPNAFERIVGGLGHMNSGDIWVTAHPGFEFATKDTTVHVDGGSHGSLHAQDSLSPLIVGGVPMDYPLPSRPRAVDVTPLCLQLLGVEARPLGGPALDSQSKV